jgi:hypothetical protein
MPGDQRDCSSNNGSMPSTIVTPNRRAYAVRHPPTCACHNSYATALQI